jgi:four helix bundle protein
LENKDRKVIKSYEDLEVYQNSYNASIKVIKQIVNKLPVEEKTDLQQQMRRSCKAIPRLIAEGYAKKHQKKAFQKYLDDSKGESNEMIVSLNHCKDLYPNVINTELCEELIDIYDKTSRQLFNLAAVWTNFNDGSIRKQKSRENKD